MRLELDENRRNQTILALLQKFNWGKVVADNSKALAKGKPNLLAEFGLSLHETA